MMPSGSEVDREPCHSRLGIHATPNIWTRFPIQLTTHSTMISVWIDGWPRFFLSYHSDC
jgi:hypothetical protein